MRILGVSTFDRAGGAERIAYDLIQGYRRHGRDAWLAVGAKRGDDSFTLPMSAGRERRAENPAAPLWRPDAELVADIAAGREIFDFPAAWDLLDLPPEKPDLLHCHNLHHLYFDLRALPWLSRRTPTVLTLHDAWLLAGNCAHSLDCERWRTGCGDCPDISLYPGLKKDGTAENWRRKQAILRQSRLYVATPCRWLMTKAETGMLGDAMIENRVIRQGVDISLYRPGDRAEARRRLGLPDDVLALLFAANGIRANPWKDFASLRRVLAGLADRLPNRNLVLIGLGESGPSEMVGSAKLIFVPFQHNPEWVAELYRAVDVYVHMARAETFPNVVMEALCCGAPVVATAVGGIAEQVASAFPFNGQAAAGPDRANGVLVAPGDVDATVAALALLLEDSALRTRLGANAARNGREMFDFQRTVREYLDWFDNIAAVSPPPDRPVQTVQVGWTAALAEALRQGQPVSRTFGLDRGSPIDRYYIENFLGRESDAVRGKVLEIGGSTYTRHFGGARVTRSDVLHAKPGNPQATIIGDLAREGDLPEASFDCVILTQTLQFIYDYRTALANIRRSLAPGGVLLTTFPGLSQISRYDMDQWGDFWRFTSLAAERLFNDIFADDRVEVFRYGNATAATAFLNGLATQDLPAGMLDSVDPDYEMVIAVKVIRNSAVAKPRRAARTGAGAGTPPVIVMYHRVADTPLDPQLLSVQPDRFNDHLSVLVNAGDLMPLAEMVDRLAAGKPVDGTIAITFDDGYADNLHVAKPLLEAHDAPATVFVTAGMVGSDEEFWWDDLERLFLTTDLLPAALTLRTAQGDRVLQFGDGARYGEAERRRDAAWSVLDPRDPTARHAAYRILQQVVHGLGSYAQRRAVLIGLAAWSGAGTRGRFSHRIMRPEEVSGLVAGGLVTVGAHTMTHPVLSRLPIEEQRDEIFSSRKVLEDMIGQPVALFAYPYGTAASLTTETVAAVREFGFKAACTTNQSPVSPNEDIFLLPRMNVRNWTAEIFEQQLAALRLRDRAV